jgi:chromosome segregation ATPase
MDANTVRPLPQAVQLISAEYQDSSGELPRVLAAFEAAATALRERAEAAEARANRAEAENDRLVADLRAERERSTADLARQNAERSRVQAAVDRAEQDRNAATIRADQCDQALAGHQAAAAALRDRIEGLLSQIAASAAEAKLADDRAWASGETAGALRDQLAATERRFEAERKRAERAEKRADNDREALLNSESKTWRTLAALEAADKRDKYSQSKLAEAKAAAEMAIRSANAIQHEDEVRRARGLLVRLLAAWRGR